MHISDLEDRFTEASLKMFFKEKYALYIISVVLFAAGEHLNLMHYTPHLIFNCKHFNLFFLIIDERLRNCYSTYNQKPSGARQAS